MNFRKLKNYCKKNDVIDSLRYVFLLYNVLFGFMFLRKYILFD